MIFIDLLATWKLRFFFSCKFFSICSFTVVADVAGRFWFFSSLHSRVFFRFAYAATFFCIATDWLTYRKETENMTRSVVAHFRPFAGACVIIIIWLCQSKHDFYVFRICYSITSLSVLTDRDHNQYLTKCFLLFSTRSEMSVVSHSLLGTFKIYTYMTSTRTLHSIASTSHQFRLHNMTQWFIVYRIISVFCVKIVWVYCATIFVQSARWAAKHIPNAVICSKSFKSCEWYGLSDESIHCVCVLWWMTSIW